MVLTSKAVKTERIYANHLTKKPLKMQHLIVNVNFLRFYYWKRLTIKKFFNIIMGSKSPRGFVLMELQTSACYVE